MRHQFIEAHRQIWPTRMLCRVLDCDLSLNVRPKNQGVFPSSGSGSVQATQSKELKPSAADLEAYELVKRQFGICCSHSEFLGDFYRDFTGTSPDIQKAFANTDMQAQKEALKSGLTFLIMYASGNTFAANKLDRLGQTHSRSGYNIRLQLYSIWIDSLLRTVKKHVSGFDQLAEQAWRRVLQLGVTRIQSSY